MSSSSSSAVTPATHSLSSSLVFENSWLTQLSPETHENYVKSCQREHLVFPKEEENDETTISTTAAARTTTNRVKRPVYNGHYVLVEPSGLPKPRLLLYSHAMAADLLLQLSSPEQTNIVHSQDFLDFVSGNLPSLNPSWATPYALSIMGTRYSNNCPYGTGDGYGDGRAITIGILQVNDNNDNNKSSSSSSSYELQLKGAGTTPFCRGADGRAVLRSSIREFLASEAMFALNVPTTRALSLVVSDELTIARPWYSETAKLVVPSLDDPRLQKYPLAQRQQILQQLRTQKADPNIMIQEAAAITCRVCRSFVRIGHIDLFSRRAERKNVELGRQSNNDNDNDKTDKRWHTDTREWKELEQIIWHTCYREFRNEAYDPYYFENKDLASAASVLLTLSADRLSHMVAQWIRVGFAQGNFNGDNCLVGGNTMDYGPFGFMEEYNPLFAKWTGSGQHFGFMNQPSAGFANYNVLVESVVPVICAARQTEDVDAVIKEFVDPAAEKFEAAVDTVLRNKLGFQADQDLGDDVWEVLETMMRKTRTDWTLLFRQLTYVVRDFPDMESTDYEAMMRQLEGDDAVREGSSPFYEPLDDETRKEWIAWMDQWRTALHSLDESGTEVYERMRTTNPKYILREWMLVDAYNSAAQREEAELFSLYSLIQRPYDEGSAFEESKYYRRAPDEALHTGGTAFMS